MAGDDNSGVFVGFPDPGTDPWVAVDHGYEIQIDATDDPDSTTGAVYNFKAADTAARDAVLNPPGEWNRYELVVEGNRIRVYLNETLINDFTSTDPQRMTSPSFIGLQNHGNGDDVWFRNVQIKDLTAPVLRDSTTTATASPAKVKVGRGTTVTVTVAADGALPTGQVQLKSGAKVLGSGTLSGGKVAIPTGVLGPPGARTLTAVYGGDATTRPSSGTVVVTVETPAGGSGNPPGGGPGGDPPVTRPALSLRGARADANRKRRKATLRVRCAQGGGDCAGAVRLRIGGKTAGTGRFAVAAGENGTIRIALNRKARKALKKSKRPRATLRIAYADGRTEKLPLRLTR
jgi:hypothetical protein